ncbi:MAG: hypothetical protein JSS66_12765 [Armatimonadetes bacterium]|nr:hypothetical protein [Armatimonadota bacterium]
MRTRTLIFAGTSLLVLAGVAVAQDQGVQSVIGNVFLQNTTPGTAQIGHATITGTFRAGQVFVQQGSTATIPVVGNNISPTGNTFGGSFSAASPSGIALRATATSMTGGTRGIIAESRSASGAGVEASGFSGVLGHGSGEQGGLGVFGSGHTAIWGHATGAVAGAAGGFFDSALAGSNALAVAASNTARGIDVGQFSSGTQESIRCTNSDATNTGVCGRFVHLGPGIGVKAFVINTTGSTYGVWGESDSTVNGTGVFGFCPNNGSNVNVGVYGRCTSPTGYGVFSDGRTGATGTKSFVIDHPLDPENRYLMHYSAEGPEPRNLYEGSVVTGADGFAWVTLPDYYESVNRDPLIQLTVYDASSDFVMAKVTKDVQNGRFQVRTSKGHVKVAWRVDAIRNDRWMQKMGSQAEPMKPKGLRGTYLQPELYGMPASRGQLVIPDDKANTGNTQRP